MPNGNCGCSSFSERLIYELVEAYLPACKLFGVRVERDIAGASFDWPIEPYSDELEGNHYYEDLRFVGWSEVATSIRMEKVLLARFERATSHAEGARVISESLDEAASQLEWEDPLSPPLYGLDLGVASATCALAAYGCLPYSSCNGGVLGDTHVAAYPIVAFFMTEAAAPRILEYARKADAGLLPLGCGRFQLFADDIHKLLAFAELMLAEH